MSIADERVYVAEVEDHFGRQVHISIHRTDEGAENAIDKAVDTLNPSTEDIEQWKTRIHSEAIQD